MKAIVQLCLWDEPEIIDVGEPPELTPQATSVIKECRGKSDYDQKKLLMLTREYIRRELRNYFGCVTYPALIQSITDYNDKQP